MRIDELIDRLHAFRKEHGNVKVATWDGDTSKVRLEPSFNGVAPTGDEKANEVVIEIYTVY